MKVISIFKKVASLIVGITLIVGCSMMNKTEPLDYETYVIVGEGGGFAGSYIQYKINQNGSIEQLDFNEEKYIEIAKVSTSYVDGFFNRIEELNLGELEISSPGNMSRYIEINYMDINDHKLIWAMESTSINPDVKSFFIDAFNFCKALNE